MVIFLQIANLFFRNLSNDLRISCLDNSLNMKHIIPLETVGFQPNNRDIGKTKRKLTLQITQ